MSTKKTELEKVKGKHYEIGNIETIRIIECIVGRDEIPRKPAYAIGRRRTTCTVHALANG